MRLRRLFHPPLPIAFRLLGSDFNIFLAYQPFLQILLVFSSLLYSLSVCRLVARLSALVAEGNVCVEESPAPTSRPHYYTPSSHRVETDIATLVQGLLAQGSPRMPGLQTQFACRCVIVCSF